jgi:outer membrane protein TolC
MRHRQTILIILTACGLLFCGPGPAAAVAQPATPVLSLETAIEQTLANHPLRQAALEQQLAAKATSTAAKADLLPKLSTSYSYFRLHNQPYFRIHPVGKIPYSDKDVNVWSIQAVQPLFTGFQLTTRNQMAGLELKGKELARKQLSLDLIKNAKLAYYQIFLAQKHLQVARKTVGDLKLHETDTQALYEQGIVAYNDLLQARVALAQARRLEEGARRDLEIAKARLNLLMNHDIDADFEVEKIKVELDDDSPDPQPLYHEALAQRPEIRHLEIKLEEAGMAVTLAKGKFYPTVSLVGTYQQVGDNFGGSRNSYMNSDTAAVGIMANWTFFEWGKTRAQTRARQHQQQALKKKLEAVANRIRLEVKTALSDLRLARVNTRTAEAAVDQAEENYRMTNLQYKQQMANSTTLLDAATFLERSRNNYYDSLYGYLMARAELDRALGRR